MKPRNFLRIERDVTERFLPGLIDRLTAIDLEVLESRGNPGIGLFREAGGPALLVPSAHGGLGANPIDAVRVHRMLGALAPSLSIAATMHNFSLATLVGLDIFGGDDYSATLLSSIASQRLYLASGFAEGKSGANILASTMRARPYRGGWAISGKKQPCSLSASMDLLSASVTVVDGDRHARAVALVPADSPGIRIEPFWKSPILAGAESDSVILEDVFVPKDFVSFPQTEGALDPLEKLGYFWFWLLICASYTGIASALIDRVIREARGSAQDRAAMAAKIELCQAGLEGVAATAELGKPDVSSELPRLLLVRHELEEAIVQAASLAAGALGGMAFVGSGAVARLLASTRPLAMHPPGRATTIAALARFLEGESLELV